MRPTEVVKLAIDVAEDGLNAGEMPIGALVLAGDRVVATAHTQEQALGRRIVHADLLALLEADRLLGRHRSTPPLTLVVNLEPCLMCMGAAITLGIERVWFGLESPNDGAIALLEQWQPPVEQPFFRRPREIIGGLHRATNKDQFARYSVSSGPAGMGGWAGELSLP